MVLNNSSCLFKGLGKPELCEPRNSAYIAMHGHSGTGGRLGASRVPEDYAGTLLSDLTLETQGGTLKRDLEAYVKSFEKQFDDVKQKLRDEGHSKDRIRIKSLYLWSENAGTGKTTVACAMLQEYLLRNFLGSVRRGQAPPLAPVYFLDLNEWQTEYNTFNRPKVPEATAEVAAARYYRAMDKAMTAEFAVLDDLGVRDSTEGFRGDLHTIINHRVSKELPTVYTSNIPIEELPNTYGEIRMMDRIKHMTMPIHFEGNSQRGMKR